MGQSWKTIANQILTYLGRIPPLSGGNLPVTDSAIGATTDAVASIVNDETASAGTHIGIIKAIKNLVIDGVGYLATIAGAISGGKMLLGALIAGEAHIGQVGGHTSIVTGTLTRPNDTPGVYTAKDEINSSTSAATYITFANVARANGSGGTITFAAMKTNNPAATMQHRLRLYSIIPTPNHDHDPFVESWAEEDHLIGYIDFGAPVVAGTGSDMASVQVPAVNMTFQCAPNTRDIYGRDECLAAGAAPAASQVYKFTLRSLVD
jgi:hypothetical protein